MTLTFTKLREANTERLRQWEAGTEFDLTFLGNALAGEVGEACNVIKKLARASLGAVGSRATPNDLGEELADVIIYADLIAKKLGLDLGVAVKRKFNKTSERYGLVTRLE